MAANVIKFFPKDFSSLKNDWERLETGEEMTPFQSYQWYDLLNRFYGKSKPFISNVVYYAYKNSDGQITMIAPVLIRKIYTKPLCLLDLPGGERAAYLFGSDTCTDYLNYIYKEFDPIALCSLLDQIQADYHLSKFYFSRMAHHSSVISFLKECHNPCKKRYTHNYVALNVPGSVDDYNKMLKKSAKQNFRTAINRQVRNDIKINYAVMNQVLPEEAKTIFSIYVSRKSIRYQNKLKKMRLSSRIFLQSKNILRSFFNKTPQFLYNAFLSHNGQNWFFIVRHNEKIIGFYYGLYDRQKKNVYVICAGLDDQYDFYSPCVSSMYEQIKTECGEDAGIKNIDFLWGNEKYKYDLGGNDLEVCTYLYLHQQKGKE